MPDRPTRRGGRRPRRPIRRRRPLRARRPVRRPVKRKPAEMPSAPWEGLVATSLRERFGDSVRKTQLLGGQKLAIVAIESVADILEMLKDEHGFDYLVDVTAVHWPKKDKQFEVTWILYSFASNSRVRLKAELAEGAKVPSATRLYNSANWLEREAYDMFGIEFENHPDPRRILMPDEWEGFPLRKEYGIIQQDSEWVRENLKIESAQ